LIQKSNFIDLSIFYQGIGIKENKKISKKEAIFNLLYNKI